MADALVPALPLSSPLAEPIDRLVGAVASLVGGASSPAAQAKAIECLDRAADRLNMAGLHLFRSKELTLTSGVEILAGAESAAMPPDWAWPIDPITIRNSNGDLVTRGEWKPWDIFRFLQGNTSDTACPKYFALRSEIDGLIYFAPRAKLADFGSITLSYVARIQNPSEAQGLGQLVLVPEVREALLTGGLALMTQFRYLKFPAIWTPMFADFNQRIDLAKAAQARWLEAAHMSAVPEEAGHLYMFNSSYLGPRYTYVRVP